MAYINEYEKHMNVWNETKTFKIFFFYQKINMIIINFYLLLQFFFVIIKMYFNIKYYMS